jgi:Sulfotransferase family
VSTPTASPSPPGAALRYVFVVTYGRSGSTLTQGMLNTLPRTLVRGENNLFLLPMFRAYAGLEAFQGKFGGPGAAKSSSAFYGLREVDLDAFAASVRELVQRQLLGDVAASDVDRLGFKEVLWHRIKPKEWAGFFAFMDLAFADPLYVLNRRDVAMTSTSGFWKKKQPGVAEQQITRVRRLQDFLRQSRPERTFDTRFEDMTSDDRGVAGDLLRGLAEFVTGSCDDELVAAMFATRETGHGPNPFGKTRSS